MRLTGRRTIRVSGAVHPGWPLLGTVVVFVGGRVRGCDVGFFSSGYYGGGGDGAAGLLRVGTRQVDGRAERFDGSGRRGRPSAAAAGGPVGGVRRDSGSGRGGRGAVAEAVQVLKLQIVEAVQPVDVSGVLLLLVVMAFVVVDVAVVANLVVSEDRGRGTATGRAAAEFRTQYVVYAELQRSLGRAVQPIAVLRRPVVAVARLADRQTVTAVSAVELGGHRDLDAAVLQAVGHHGGALRRVQFVWVV